MDRFVLIQDEIDFLGSTVLVESFVSFVPIEEMERKLDAEWEKIVAQIPTAKRSDLSKRPSLRGTTFSIQHPITGEDQTFAYDTVMDALPDVDFNSYVLEYGSEVQLVSGDSFSKEEFDAEIARRRALLQGD